MNTDAADQSRACLLLIWIGERSCASCPPAVIPTERERPRDLVVKGRNSTPRSLVGEPPRDDVRARRLSRMRMIRVIGVHPWPVLCSSSWLYYLGGLGVLA